MRGRCIIAAVTIAAITGGITALARSADPANTYSEITLARLRWGSDLGGFRRGGFSSAWNHDFPRAEQHLSLIIKDITGGSTNTASYGYQAFKGTPRLVYRVDARTGAETLVRGVTLEGTPLSSLSKIVAAGDRYAVFNGYCGAESGYVPVSTVAPAVLLTEIELQRSQRTRQKPMILPPPWADPAHPQPRPSGPASVAPAGDGATSR